MLWHPQVQPLAADSILELKSAIWKCCEGLPTAWWDQVNLFPPSPFQLPINPRSCFSTWKGIEGGKQDCLILPCCRPSWHFEMAKFSCKWHQQPQVRPVDTGMSSLALRGYFSVGLPGPNPATQTATLHQQCCMKTLQKILTCICSHKKLGFFPPVPRHCVQLKVFIIMF